MGCAVPVLHILSSLPAGLRAECESAGAAHTLVVREVAEAGYAGAPILPEAPVGGGTPERGPAVQGQFGALPRPRA